MLLGDWGDPGTGEELAVELGLCFVVVAVAILEARETVIRGVDKAGQVQIDDSQREAEKGSAKESNRWVKEVLDLTVNLCVGGLGECSIKRSIEEGALVTATRD